MLAEVARPMLAGGGLRGLALRLQRCERLADLLGVRSQFWLLLPQLGDQRLEAQVGISSSSMVALLQSYSVDGGLKLKGKLWY